ncbi:MAG: hypothetical protein EOP48_23150, partial [Sphingobacteriales bacterium]
MKLNFILLILLLSSGTANSQDFPGKRDSLFSTVLNEKRIVQVCFPKNYKQDSKEKYDVLYVLDGESNVKLFSQICEFTTHQKYTPSLIVVGIFNVNRNRDFLPTKTKTKSSGGGANFLSFIKQELIPYVNKMYPTSGENLLYGHSLGGVFAMYTLLTEPQLFASYILTDPSFWYDDNSLCKLTAQKINSISGLEKAVYISGRDNGMKDMGIDVMDSVLKIHAPKDLYYKIEPYENETHSSLRFKTMYDGLKFAYTGHKTKDDRIEYHPMNGIVLKDKPYVIHNVSGFKDSRYTTNGISPSLESPNFAEQMTFSGEMKLNIKAFTPRNRYNKSISGNFILGSAPEPIKTPAKFIPGGLAYTYYEGNWLEMPDFKKLKSKKTGIADKDFTFNKLPAKTQFACIFEGLIEIKEEGYYVLCTDADDGSKLYLN